jgi:FixJ family two-component response regulator
MIHILIVEDSDADAHLAKVFLTSGMRGGFRLERAGTLANALGRLVQGGIDVVLLDLNLSDSQGLETFEQVNGRSRDVPVIVLTSWDEEDAAVEAVRRGAQDYLVKGKTSAEFLVRSLRFAMVRAAARRRHEARRAASSAESADIAKRLEPLTLREREVLDQIVQGRPLKQIAAAMGTSYYTVKNQRAGILRKTHFRSVAELIRAVMIARFGGHEA